MKRRARWLSLVAAGLFVLSCRTDLGDQVGDYTYDQAVDKYGQPYKTEQGPNGELVGWWADVGKRSIETITLTFGPDGKLTKVEKDRL